MVPLILGNPQIVSRLTLPRSCSPSVPGAKQLHKKSRIWLLLGLCERAADDLVPAKVLSELLQGTLHGMNHSAKFHCKAASKWLTTSACDSLDVLLPVGPKLMANPKRFALCRGFHLRSVR